MTTNLHGKSIGKKPNGSVWLYSVPWGFRKLLVWLHHRYNHTSIVVTENGCVDPLKNDSTGSSSVLNDTFRVNYHRQYLNELRKAKFIDNVPINGYFIWSLLDSRFCY